MSYVISKERDGAEDDIEQENTIVSDTTRLVPNAGNMQIKQSEVSSDSDSPLKSAKIILRCTLRTPRTPFFFSFIIFFLVTQYSVLVYVRTSKVPTDVAYLLGRQTSTVFIWNHSFMNAVAFQGSFVLHSSETAGGRECHASTSDCEGLVTASDENNVSVNQKTPVTYFHELTP